MSITFARLMISVLLLVFLGSSGAAGAAQGSASSGSALEFLKGVFGGEKEPELLPPEQAFKVKLQVRDAHSLVARFEPASGYYLYRDKIRFVLKQPPGARVAGLSLPDGNMKADPTFGTVAVFRSPFEAVVSLERGSQAEQAASIYFTYQGCSDFGVCYPPVEKTMDIVLPAAGAAPDAGSGGVGGEDSRRQEGTAEGWSIGTYLNSALNPDTGMKLFEGGSLLWVLVGFFGFGLLLSLTPCVWPMFPILSGIIAGQGAAVGKGRAFFLSASYVLGMALTYAVIGVIAGLTGSLLSTALQSPWTIAAMATVFVALALSMFGLYEIRLPSFLQGGTGDGAQARSSAGVFGMGALSAVVVGPCIAAPLAAALLYISQSQDVMAGGSALFAMGLGKGVPLLLVGTSLGSILPRSGPWMDSIKVFLGVLLLAGALWVVAPYLPVSLTMALAGVLLVSYAVYLWPLGGRNARRVGPMRKAVGVAALLGGGVYITGAVVGSGDFLQPLAGWRSAAQHSAVAPVAFERVKTVQELDARLRDTQGRYVMLDFYADWCVSCKEMERFTFTDPAVKAKLQDVVLLQADVTANSVEDKALLSRFGLFGPPGIIFFDREGREIKGRRVIGFMRASRFTDVLNDVYK